MPPLVHNFEATSVVTVSRRRCYIYPIVSVKYYLTVLVAYVIIPIN